MIQIGMYKEDVVQTTIAGAPLGLSQGNRATVNGQHLVALLGEPEGIAAPAAGEFGGDSTLQQSPMADQPTGRLLPGEAVLPFGVPSLAILFAHRSRTSSRWPKPLLLSMK